MATASGGVDDVGESAGAVAFTATCGDEGEGNVDVGIVRVRDIAPRMMHGCHVFGVVLRRGD